MIDGRMRMAAVSRVLICWAGRRLARSPSPTMARLFFAALTTALLSACTLGPDYKVGPVKSI